MTILKHSEIKSITKPICHTKIFINFLFVIVFGYSSITFANNNVSDKNISNSSENVESLVSDILKDTEASLALVESNSETSLKHVNNALTLIKEIKKELSPDTHAESKSPLKINNTKEYWFIYPRVSENIINNSEIFPTLHSKFNTNILYRGDKHGIKTNKFKTNKLSAYFDYAFAYASLITAKEALIANNYQEAKSSLRWVFEAVYINPDFNVVEVSSKLILDPQPNINGVFPMYSNVTK